MGPRGWRGRTKPGATPEHISGAAGSPVYHHAYPVQIFDLSEGLGPAEPGRGHLEGDVVRTRFGLSIAAVDAQRRLWPADFGWRVVVTSCSVSITGVAYSGSTESGVTWTGPPGWMAVHSGGAADAVLAGRRERSARGPVR